MSFFQRATLLVSALSALVHVRAGPDPDHVKLAQKYAPQFRFHYNEDYFPSTVEHFLGGPYLGTPSPLTNENIANIPDHGSNTYITANIDIELRDFLMGQNPETSQLTTYTFIDPRLHGVVDLWYWIFCPFNAGKTLGPFGYKGYHVGDWEYIIVRTVDGVPQWVLYPGQRGSGGVSIPWEKVPKFSPSSPRHKPDPSTADPDARPVAYVALGDHTMYSSVGNFTYHAGIFKLEDVTTDGGVYWDTQGSLTTIDVYDSFSGSLNWINYQGHWGNKEFNNCWKEGTRDICDIDDGPYGPMQSSMMGRQWGKRDASNTPLEPLRARGSPSSVMATISPGNPSYTFNTDATGARFVAVEQVCASVTTGSDGKPTRSYAYSFTTTVAQVGPARYTVEEVPACKGYSYVFSYAIGLCRDKSDCSYGYPREIVVYSEDPNVFGSQQTSVVVNDLDDWTL